MTFNTQMTLAQLQTGVIDREQAAELKAIREELDQIEGQIVMDV